MRIIEKGFDEVNFVRQEFDEDYEEYLEQLKERIIYTYLCILHGINDKEPNGLLLEGLEKLVGFLENNYVKLN